LQERLKNINLQKQGTLDIAGETEEYKFAETRDTGHCRRD